jgi:hypothetical protein
VQPAEFTAAQTCQHRNLEQGAETVVCSPLQEHTHIVRLPNLDGCLLEHRSVSTDHGVRANQLIFDGAGEDGAQPSQDAPDRHGTTTGSSEVGDEPVYVVPSDVAKKHLAQLRRGDIPDVALIGRERRLVRTFREVFGLSEETAEAAACGRGGPSVRPVCEPAGRSSAAPQPGDALRLVRRIEELAAGLRRRGVSEEKALREAAFAVFEAAPDDSTQEWVAQVTGRRWPGLWRRPGSSKSVRG